MKVSASLIVMAATAVLLSADIVPYSPLRVGLVSDAQAWIGRPATPMSYAGVARRTAYRTTAVVATGAAVATTAAVATAAVTSTAIVAADAAAATPHPVAPPPAGKIPIGTIVPHLPSGCVSAPVNGVEYYLCGGNYYRATFQGNNLIYVVQQP